MFRGLAFGFSPREEIDSVERRGELLESVLPGETESTDVGERVVVLGVVGDVLTAAGLPDPSRRKVVVARVNPLEVSRSRRSLCSDSIVIGRSAIRS